MYLGAYVYYFTTYSELYFILLFLQFHVGIDTKYNTYYNSINKIIQKYEIILSCWLCNVAIRLPNKKKAVLVRWPY